jgi:hypothetical protein
VIVRLGYLCALAWVVWLPVRRVNMRAREFFSEPGLRVADR